MNKITLVCIFIFLLIASCKKNENEQPRVSTLVLIDAAPIASQSKENSKNTLANATYANINLPSDKVKYDITTYAVTYHTTYKGEKITASGLVTLPSTTDAVAMLSFQHGTISTFAEAPSALRPAPFFSLNAIMYQLCTLPASFGLIVAAPDYIGFGASKQHRHPYYIDEATSTAIVDLLKAAKELAAVKSTTFNGKLFLAGYSQGGYATLSAHRAIEKKPIEGITLLASFPAAGGYDLVNMQKIIFGLPTYDEPFYIGYVLSALKNFYGMKDIYTTILKPLYAEKIDGLYDGMHSSTEINAALTTSIPNLIMESARTSFETDANYKPLADALKNNSLIDWKPVKPIYFYHGDADTTVPYQTTIDTYHSLLKAGADKDLIKSFTLKGKDHESGAIPYVEAMIKEVLAWK